MCGATSRGSDRQCLKGQGRAGRILVLPLFFFSSPPAHGSFPSCNVSPLKCYQSLTDELIVLHAVQRFEYSQTILHSTFLCILTYIIHLNLCSANGSTSSTSTLTAPAGSVDRPAHNTTQHNRPLIPRDNDTINSNKHMESEYILRHNATH